MLTKVNSSVILFTILCLGAFLRLYNFGSLNFYGDAARDILIAKHIIEHEGFVNISPGASAGWGLIHNSPLYFWMLAYFWFFLRSPYLLSLVFAFFGILAIFVGYKAGSLLLNRSTGYTLAFLISVSHIHISFSGSVFQPHFIPFITIFCVYLFIKLLRSGHLLWFMAYILMVFMGLHIHYSFLPVFCIFSLWALLYWMKQYTKQGAIISLIPLFFYILLLLVWINLTYTKTPFDQFSFFTEVLQKNRADGNLELIFLRSHQVIRNLFSFGISSYWPNLILTIIFFGGLYASYKEVIKQKTYKMLFLVSLISSVVTTSLYVDPQAPIELYAHYYAPYYILILTLIAYLINKYISKTQLKLVAALAFGYLLIRGYGFFSETPMNTYSVMEQISKSIFKDYNSLHTNKLAFAVFDHNPNEEQFDYYTGQYYYFLEKFTGEKLIQFANDDRNIIPIEDKPDKYYLVCSWFAADDNQQKFEDKCIKPFQNQYFSFILPDSVQKVSQINQGQTSFSVYRFDKRLIPP